MQLKPEMTAREVAHGVTGCAAGHDIPGSIVPVEHSPSCDSLTRLIETIAKLCVQLGMIEGARKENEACALLADEDQRPMLASLIRGRPQNESSLPTPHRSSS